MIVDLAEGSFTVPSSSDNHVFFSLIMQRTAMDALEDTQTCCTPSEAHILDLEPSLTSPIGLNIPTSSRTTTEMQLVSMHREQLIGCTSMRVLVERA